VASSDSPSKYWSINIEDYKAGHPFRHSWPPASLTWRKIPSEHIDGQLGHRDRHDIR
jgi:hypothetical protein